MAAPASSPASQYVEKFKTVMDDVYGPFQDNWKPKPYAENKGRYLWTDAFGVCNYITLFCETGEQKYLDQADALIRDVHNTLGKNRKLTARLGPSTDDHPLRGGLRIGKEHEEGHPDGDGQYYHYLTKWMFALNKMSLARNNKLYNDWAIELAESIHDKFVIKQGSGRPRMFWKMSIDLSHPHVPSEGNLDPYDGYITYRLLREVTGDNTILERQISELEIMVQSKYKQYQSDDPLDLGESLWITHWYPEEEWAKLMSTRAIKSLDRLYQTGYFNAPRKYRLGFREFGTTIGGQVNPMAGKDWINRAKDLNEYWFNYLYERDRDITPVMYCSSLIPGVWNKDYSKLKKQS